MKLKLEIEVECDIELMHGNDPDSIGWFRDAVLLNPAEDEQLILHSNCIGDEIGPVRVTRIISGLSNTPAHSPPPLDPRFARFGEAMWEYITKRGGDFCRDEISEDILPLAEAAGLCCRVKYDPKIHGDMIDAEPGCEIWWWGNF